MSFVYLSHQVNRLLLVVYNLQSQFVHLVSIFISTLHLLIHPLGQFVMAAQGEYEWFTVNSEDKETIKPILNSSSDDEWSIRSDEELNESYVTLVKPQNDSMTEINALCFLFNYTREITFIVGQEVKIPSSKNRPTVVLYPKNQLDEKKKFKCVPRGFSFNFYNKELLSFQLGQSNVSFNLYLVTDYGGFTHKKEIRAQLASLLDEHPNKIKILVFDDEKWKFIEHVLDIEDEPKRITPPFFGRERSFMLVFIDLVPLEVDQEQGGQ